MKGWLNYIYRIFYLPNTAELSVVFEYSGFKRATFLLRLWALFGPLVSKTQYISLYRKSHLRVPRRNFRAKIQAEISDGIENYWLKVWLIAKQHTYNFCGYRIVLDFRTDAVDIDHPLSILYFWPGVVVRTHQQEHTPNWRPFLFFF